LGAAVIATALIAIPLVAALASIAPFSSRVARPLAVLASAAVGALALWTLGAPGSSALRLSVDWARPLGAGYTVATDALSLLFIVFAALLFAVGALASGRVGDRRAYFALWSAVQAAVNGAFVARDLLLLVVCWETMLVAIAVLMWHWGGRDGRAAGRRFVGHMLAGSALLLVALASMAVARGSLDMDLLAARPIGATGQLLPAMLFLAAFAVALPLFPFHGWLADSYAVAPVPVAMVIAGIVASAAVNGILRVCLGLFPQGMLAAAPVLVAIAAVGAVYAALVATRQDDLRHLVAYGSMSQLNLVALALFSATATSVRGAVFATLSHGLVVAALLLVGAAVARRVRSYSLSRAGGLASSTPVLAGCATLAACAAVGVPGTSGFAGTVIILAGAYERFPAAVAVAAFALVIAAVYALRAIRRAFHGAPTASGRDLAWRERALIVPLLALVIALGVVPHVVTDRIPDDVLPRVQPQPGPTADRAP
jgi:NADH-quinone oxidoreductase subunit M